jgi:hypothetical protein
MKQKKISNNRSLNPFGCHTLHFRNRLNHSHYHRSHFHIRNLG